MTQQARDPWCLNTIFISQVDFPQVGTTLKLAEQCLNAIYRQDAYPCFLDALWHRSYGENMPDGNDWANWRMQNYGTLGVEQSTISLSITDFILRLDFRSVTTPPLELYKHMVKGGLLVVEGIALYRGNPMATQIMTQDGRLIHYQMDMRKQPAGNDDKPNTNLTLLPN